MNESKVNHTPATDSNFPAAHLQKQGYCPCFILIKKQIQVPKALSLWNLNDQRLTMMLKQHQNMLSCQKVSRCFSPALHTGKNQGQAMDFCSHTTLIATSNQEYLTHFPWACSKASCILGIHAKNQWELLLRERDVVTVLISMW